MANSAKSANNWYELFKAHDPTNRGYVFASELRRKIEQSGEQYGLSADHRDALCHICDSNADKKIDFEELCFMVIYILRTYCRVRIRG